MEVYWETLAEDVGQMAVDIATSRAREQAREPLESQESYVDSGLTPAELYALCLARIEARRERAARDLWAPAPRCAPGSSLVPSMFRFLVSVEEALDRLRVVDSGQGQQHVFVRREYLPAASA